MFRTSICACICLAVFSFLAPIGGAAADSPDDQYTRVEGKVTSINDGGVIVIDGYPQRFILQLLALNDSFDDAILLDKVVHCVLQDGKLENLPGCFPTIVEPVSCYFMYGYPVRQGSVSRVLFENNMAFRCGWRTLEPCTPPEYISRINHYLDWSYGR